MIFFLLFWGILHNKGKTNIKKARETSGISISYFTLIALWHEKRCWISFILLCHQLFQGSVCIMWRIYQQKWYDLNHNQIATMFPLVYLKPLVELLIFIQEACPPPQRGTRFYIFSSQHRFAEDGNGKSHLFIQSSQQTFLTSNPRTQEEGSAVPALFWYWPFKTPRFCFIPVFIDRFFAGIC